MNMMYISYIFSGTPIRSKIHAKKLIKLKWAVIIWTLSRFLRAILGTQEYTLLENIFAGSNPKLLMLVMASFVLIEILPIFYVLDWKFMSTFLIDSPLDESLIEPILN